MRGRSSDSYSVIRNTDAPYASARRAISIEKETLNRFFRAYPAGQRSRVIQEMIEARLRSDDNSLARAVDLVETHADFAEVRSDSELWEASTSLDGFDPSK